MPVTVRVIDRDAATTMQLVDTFLREILHSKTL